MKIHSFNIDFQGNCYLIDSGILHSLLSISNIDNLNIHPIVGASWEGFVIEQIMYHADAKGFFIGIEDLQTKQNFIITPASDTYPHKNALVCSLSNFIRDYLPNI